MGALVIGTSLGILSDADLVTVYSKAVNHRLDKRFVELLVEELTRRGLQIAC